MSRIAVPFFEVGPKNYLTRAQLIELAVAAAKVSMESAVSVIMTAPVLDIEAVKCAAPRLWVFSQLVDDAVKGNSTGAVLPEALRDAGADGVLLNHVERSTPAESLPGLIGRCRDAGLLTLVCAQDTAEAVRIAALHPDIILAEPPELIGTAGVTTRSWIPALNQSVAGVDDSILVMHAGGVATTGDVTEIIAAGASGTGATTAIVGAPDPAQALGDLVRAVRTAWDATATVMTTRERKH